ARIKDAARRVSDNAFDGGEITASDILHLIPAANGCPFIQIQGESYGWSDIVQVPRINFQVGILGVRPDEDKLAQICAGSGHHPAVKASSGDPEESGARVPQRGRHSVLFPWRAVVIPPHAEVQRQAVADFPIILEESTPFVLVNIANLEWVSGRIVPRLLCLVRAVDEAQLAHAAHRP